MAQDTKEIDVVLDLRLKGLKALEGRVTKAFGDLPSFEKSLGAGKAFDAIKNNLTDVRANADKFYAEYKSFLSDVAGAKSLLTVEDGTSDTAKLANYEKAVQALIGKYDSLGTEMGKVANFYDVQKQAASQSFQVMLKNTEKSISLMREFGLSTTTATKMLKNLNTASVSPQAKSEVAALNSEYMKRADILQDLYLLENKMKGAAAKTPQGKEFLKDLRAVKSAVKDINTPMVELKSVMKTLKVDTKVIDTFRKLDGSIEDTLASIKELNGSSKGMGRLTTELRNISAEMLQTGDTALLTEYNTKLNKRHALLKNIAVAEKAIRASKADPKDSQKALNQLNTIKFKALQPDVSNFVTMNGELAKTKDLVKDILVSEKEYLSRIEASERGITRRIGQLNKEKEAIKAKLTAGGDRVTSGDKDTGTKAITDIDAAVTKLESSLISLSSRDIIDRTKAEQAEKSLLGADLALDKIKVSAQAAKSAINFSGTVSDLKKAFQGLGSQIKDTYDDGNGFDKAKYEALTAELKKQNTLIDQGGKENVASARKVAAEVQKRLNAYVQLNAEADKLTAEAKAYGDGMEESRKALLTVASDIRNSADAQMDLTKTTEEYTLAIRKAHVTAAALKVTRKGTETVEKNLLDLQNKYESKLGDINRLMATKKRWATNANLEEARKLAVELKVELDKVQVNIKELNAEKLKLDPDVDKMAKLSREIKASKARMIELDHATKGVKSSLAELSGIKWFSNIAKRATAYLALYAGFSEVIQLFRKGVGAVVAFDTQVRTMSAVFDMSQASAKRLGHELIGLSKAWGGSVGDINEAALALGRAGIATNKVTEATEIVIKMARLTGDSIAVSANAMITYQQVFGDTHPILKELGDQLAYVANQSRLSTQDIGTFSNYALATASAAGISMEAINAMAISFSNAGVNASTIGTQIRRFSSLLKNNSTSAREFFEKMGTSQQRFSNRLNESTEESDRAMKELIGNLKNLSDVEFGKAVAGMDILATNSITLLRNNADAYMRHFDALSAGVEGEIDKANLISESYASSYEKLGSAAGEAFEKLTAEIAPAIQRVMTNMQAGFEWLGNEGVGTVKVLVTTFGSLLTTFIAIKAVSLVTAMFTSLVAVFGSLAGAITIANRALTIFKINVATSGGIVAMTRAVGALRLAFMSLNAIPVVLAITAIAGAAYYLYDAFVDTTKVAVELTEEQLKGASRVGKATKALAESEKLLSKEKLKLVNIIEDQQTANTSANIEARSASEAKIKKLKEEIVLNKEILAIDSQRSKITKVEVEENTLNSQLKDLNSAKIADADRDWLGIAKIERQLETLANKKIKLHFEADMSKVETMLYDAKNKAKQWEAVITNYKSGPNYDPESKALKTMEANAFKAKEGVDSLTEALKLMNDENKNTGDKSVWDIMTERSFTAMDKMGKNIISLDSNGKDVTAAFEYFTTKMTGFSETIQNTYAATITKAVDAIKVKMEDLNQAESEPFADFLSGVEIMKNAEGDLNTFTAGLVRVQTAADKLYASGLIDKDTLAKIKELEASSERSAQALAKVEDASTKMNVALDKTPSLKGMVANAEKLSLKYSEVNRKILEGVDVTDMLSNAHLTVFEANQLINKAVAWQGELMAGLLTLGIRYSEVMAGITNGTITKAAGEAMIGGIVQGMTWLADQTGKVGENLKGARASLDKAKKDSKSLGKSSKGTAGSASKEADARKKSLEHLEKTKALIAGLKGDNLLKYALEAKRVFAELYENLSGADVTEQAAAYTENKLWELDKIRGEQLASDSGNPLAQEMKEWETRLQVVKDHYDKRIGVMQGHQDALADIVKEGGPNALAAQQKIADLSVQIEAEAAKKKEALQEQSIKNYVSMAEKVLGQLNTVMGQFYDAMYGDAKGSYEAQMEVVASVQEEIDVNQARLDDLNAQKDANPAGVYDAEIEQLEAKDEALRNNMTEEEKKAEQDKKNEAEAKKMFDTMKKIQLAMAIASTFLAAQQAFQSAFLPVPGPWSFPLGVGLAGAAIAVGMGNVAQIAAQKYHTGGYVDQPNLNGMGGTRDDEIQATLQKGEYVLSKDDVKNIKKSYNGDNNSGNTQAALYSQMADSLKQEVVIVNSMDPAVIEDWATSRSGREVIQNVVNA